MLDDDIERLPKLYRACGKTSPPAPRHAEAITLARYVILPLNASLYSGEIEMVCDSSIVAKGVMERMVAGGHRQVGSQRKVRVSRETGKYEYTGAL